MSSHNIIVLLFLIAPIFWINEALYLESIIGGFRARYAYFKYQAAILGKQNYSNYNHLICGGGIISENLIISAAQCFLNNLNELRELRFSVAVGTDDLKMPTTIISDVIEIYLLENDRTRATNDIAVVLIDKRLEVVSVGSIFKKLKIPASGANFCGKKAIVSGFGLNRVSTEINWENLEEFRTGGETNFTLKYARVWIANDSVCRVSYESIISTKQMCGIMEIESPGQAWGVCTGDAGSPLVINNTVIGIVSKGPSDCNDTHYGCVYTKVSSYSYFINTVIEGIFIRSTVALRNRIHFPPSIHIN